jgi:hypothetical protein
MSDSDNKELKFRGFDLQQIRHEAKQLKELYEHQQRKYRHDHADTQYGTMRVPAELLIALIDAHEERIQAYEKVAKLASVGGDLEDAIRKSRLMKSRYGLHGQECSVEATAKRIVKHHEGDMAFELDADAHIPLTKPKPYFIDTSEWDKPISPTKEELLDMVRVDLPEGEDVGSISKERLAELLNAKLTKEGIAIPKKHISGHPYSEYLDEHGFFKIDIEPEFSKGTWKESVLASLGLPPPVVGAEHINTTHAVLAAQAKAKGFSEHSMSSMDEQLSCDLCRELGIECEHKAVLCPDPTERMYPVYRPAGADWRTKDIVTIGRPSDTEPVFGWAVRHGNPNGRKMATPSGEQLLVEYNEQWPYEKTEMEIKKESPVYLVSNGVWLPKVSLQKPEDRPFAEPYGELCEGGYHCRQCILVETGREVTIFLAPENR